MLQDFCQRLLAMGKSKKLALTASMRKLVAILNSMVRTGTLRSNHRNVLTFETVASR